MRKYVYSHTIFFDIPINVFCLFFSVACRGHHSYGASHIKKATTEKNALYNRQWHSGSDAQPIGRCDTRIISAKLTVFIIKNQFIASWKFHVHEKSAYHSHVSSQFCLFCIYDDTVVS